jgi:membrane protease subunit (stomatin/prohibitin family)
VNKYELDILQRCSNLSQQAKNAYKELVERATPKKDFTDNECCFYAFGKSGDIVKNKFCPNCGQALDWSDER